jgi:hypothetical protein
MRRESASYATVLLQRFPLQTQNAVVAPLVPQIHAHGQTVEIGAKLTSPILFSCAPCFHLRIQFFPQCLHPFLQHFLVSRCIGPRDFVRFEVGSLFIAELLCFFTVDLLFM